jgi:2-polyprenyl-3-methyl-5-hydroxy-6-metoxy-1,4-benzoquinol methylase
MLFQEFGKKWGDIKTEKLEEADEKSLFVDIGKKPVTQRQLNLYSYFEFIKGYLRHDKKKLDILEIGCGRGTISLYLARYLNHNLSLLDSEQGAIDLAKKAFEKKGLKAQFYIDNGLKTKLSDDLFDVIVSIGLAEHIDEVDQLYAEQLRMLKPGGMMISLNIPKKFSVQSLNTVMRTFKKLFGKYKETVKKDYYRNDFKPEKYKDIAKMVGFDSVEIVNVLPFPIYTPISMKIDKFITKINKIILSIRGIFMSCPIKTNYVFSQAHFLIGYKK